MYLRRLLWNIFLLQMQYSFTAVDRVVQRSLPKVFVNLYGDTAYLELTNAYGLFRRCVLRLHLSLLGIQRSHPVCVADAKKGMERGIKERNVKWKEVPFLHSPFFPYPHSSSFDTSQADKSQQAYSEALFIYLRGKTDARNQENSEKCCPTHRLDPLRAAGGTLKKVTVS